LDETLFVGALPFDLGTNEFQDGTVYPEGWKYLASFDLEDGIPTFIYTFQGWRLEKKVWMEQGQNTTFVRYLLRAAPSACQLQLRPLCAYRDFHAEQRAGVDFGVTALDGALEIEAFEGACPYWLACDRPAGFEAKPDWWRNFFHRVEQERGLDSTE